MTSLLDNPAVTDPRANLSSTEIAALRHLNKYRVGRIRNGWMGADKKISLKTGKGLIAKRLAVPITVPGKSALAVTHAGKIALDKLNTRTRRV